MTWAGFGDCRRGICALSGPYSGVMAPHVRTVKTASGARAVQIVYSNRRGQRDLEHVGVAHTDAEYELLLAAAEQKLAARQPQLDLGLEDPAAAVQITASRMGVLWDLLELAYHRLGFAAAAGEEDGDVFRRLVLARIIEQTSKLDAVRVLEEAGIPAPSYATVKRRLPAYAKPSFRERVAAANADHVGLGRPRWSSTMSRPGISKRMRVTDSGNRGSRKSAGWSRRSPSVCSPIPQGSR